MTKKRRHGGHRVRNRGKVTRVNCTNCGCKVSKDKAIIKQTNKCIVSGNILKDILDASVIPNYKIPKINVKQYYCISCGVHMKLVPK